MAPANPEQLGEAAPLSKRGTVRLVSKWVRERTPGAMVRFGEGEARLLYANAEDDQSILVACRKLRRQTGRNFSADEMFAVRHGLLQAFDEADIVGIRGSDNFKDEHKMWVKRTEQVFLERASHRKKSTLVTHCLVNNDILDAFPLLLEGQRSLSVISCRNVRPVLETQHGLSDIRVYQIPSQFVKREVDDDYEASLHGVSIWPDFIENLSSRITVRFPGEIFLVGAGLFGKSLCIRIRNLGGIALDLGSCLDKMVGKKTRNMQHNLPTNKPDHIT